MSDAALRPGLVLIEGMSPADLVKRAAKLAPASIDPPHSQASCSTDVWHRLSTPARRLRHRQRKSLHLATYHQIGGADTTRISSCEHQLTLP
jgi:hypothetical protein